MIRSARCAALCVMLGPPAAAADIEAIYTNIPFHPTAFVPDGSGEQFRSPLVPFLDLHGSPLGSYWIFKAFSDADSTANEVIILGSGTMGAVVAREGDPSPIAGLAYGFMDSDCGVNESGHYAFGTRLLGGSTADDEVIFTFDGSSLVTAVREGDQALGLFDPNGAGDELFGNSLRSAHVLEDGTVAFRADLIQNIVTEYQSALYHGSTLLVQEGTSAETLAGSDFYDTLGLTFSSGAVVGDWVVEADLLLGPDTDEGVSVSGVIELRDGDVPPGLTDPIVIIHAVDMSAGGDWFARGQLSTSEPWAVRNGMVIAAGGQPIVPGSTELVANPILAVQGNGDGDHVVVTATSEGRQVVVLNGLHVIAGTGDPVTVAPATAFIESFFGNDVFLSVDLNDDLVDDRMLFAFVTLRDAGFQTLGDALIVVSLAGVLCPWDCGDGDGAVGIADFLAVLGTWGQVGAPCDFDGDGVGITDFLKVLGLWGPCP